MTTAQKAIDEILTNLREAEANLKSLPESKFSVARQRYIGEANAYRLTLDILGYKDDAPA